MNFRIPSFAALLLACAGAGVSLPVHANDRYQRDDPYVEICNHCGTVRAISRINRSSSRKTSATILGALVGGAIGNQVGDGSGRRVATVAGAVAGGAIARNAADDNRRGRTMYRISVRMDGGRTHTFDQERSFGLRPGARVEVRDGWVEPLR